jgi:hypothetical protein
VWRKKENNIFTHIISISLKSRDRSSWMFCDYWEFFFYFLLFIFIFILYIFSHSSLEPVECKTIVVDVRCWFAWAIGNWRKEKKMRIIKASKKIKKQSPFDVKKKKTQQESLKFQFKIGKNCCHEGRSQIVFNLFFLRAEYFLMFSLSVSRF